MEALVIDSRTFPPPVSSFFGGALVNVEREQGARRIVLTLASDVHKNVESAARRAKRRAIFDKCRLDLTDFKFNRDEANDYD